MKRLLFIAVVMSTVLFSCKQPVQQQTAANPVDSLRNSNPYVTADQSPMDMSWCPAEYPIEKMKGNDSLKLIGRVIYSRPHRKGRQIFGDAENNLCPYGKPWRLGANEATELDLFENVSIAGHNVPKGMYILYCIPHADHWTIILNSNLNTWGLHINSEKDIFKTDIPVTKQFPALEDFTMVFQNTDTGADLVMAWDNVKAVLPVTFAK